MEHRTFHRILAAIIAVLIVLAGYDVYYSTTTITPSTSATQSNPIQR